MSNRASAGLTGSTLSGFFWTLLGFGAQGVLQLAVLMVLARLLTPADFGVVSAAMVVVSFSQIFSQLGVGDALVQRRELTPLHLRSGFTLSLIFGGAMTVLVWAGSWMIAGFFRIDNLAPVIHVMALVFLLQGAGVVGESLLQRELKFRKLALIEVAAFGLGFGVVGIGMALAGWGVWSLAGAQVSQSAIKALGLMIAEPHPKTPTFNPQASRDLLWFGGGLTVARIGNYFGVQGDSIVVGRFLGAEALGVYGRAYQLMSNPAMFLGQILDRVLFPAMSKVQDRAGDLKKVFRRGVVLIALVILPGSTAMCVLAPEVVMVVLGPGWEAAVTPFRILALGMLFRTSYKMSDALARAAGAVYRRAWRMWIYGALVMGGAALGSPWGVEGATWCVMLAIGANFMLMAQLSLRLVEMSWSEFLKAHVAALRLTVFTVSVTWAAAWVLRDRGWPALVVGAGSLILPAAGILLGVRLAPDFVLGEDGRWILRTLADHLPGRRAAAREAAYRGEP